MSRIFEALVCSVLFAFMGHVCNDAFLAVIFHCFGLVFAVAVLLFSWNELTKRG